MAEATFSLDLHVLGPPLTFALSQDQTLHRKFEARSTLWIAPVPGGKDASTWNGFFTNKNSRIRTTCYPVFRDRSRKLLPGHCQVIDFLRFSRRLAPSRDAAFTRSGLRCQRCLSNFFPSTSPPFPSLRHSVWPLPDDRYPSGFPSLLSRRGMRVLLSRVCGVNGVFRPFSSTSPTFQSLR